MPLFSAEAPIMPKGDFLKEALSNSHRGPITHQLSDLLFVKK